MHEMPPNVEKFAHELFGETIAKLAADRFREDCFCKDYTRDIFSEDLSFMDQPVAQLQVFITDEAELGLYMGGVPYDVVMLRRKIPIKYCPFCGRDLT